jgi:quinolinate synthase
MSLSETYGDPGLDPAIRAKLAHVMPAFEIDMQAPIIARINRLKREKNAVILAHNYQTPEIFHGVADIVGDSLKLAFDSRSSTADIILMAGVHFMAETAKLLNPQRKVLIPSELAGCSLAASITGADVRLMRERYPGVPVVTYVNTSAEVKAESDVCCTSANVIDIINRLGVPKVMCLPDRYLAAYAATKTDVEIISWAGACEVHERFTGAELRGYRAAHPGAIILAHPECPPDVLAEADYVGSTSGMSNYVRDQRPAKVVMITECSMSDNVAANYPDVEFVRPCNLCPHMKRITLENILESLELEHYEVTVPEDIAIRARQPIERMLEMSR